MILRARSFVLSPEVERAMRYLLLVRKARGDYLRYSLPSLRLTPLLC